ncbi:uncharacterized protein L969DRAFT_45021 [Mixia osmundae IAM 14324]|uniref:25S rRNA adenine-N(1) methyltransferase n=1 Tax=Mixia osmundae (strain CBS 9802 / IAM 14324 / JCM 22182 / KY 12970) TaxID=764103 RepID=G7DXI5_MIXOS|nr:uncharacterized protein L969DRAFT_45021 [Mixia osmundae IAM 14324]KEI41211.1 hypothetical protein L969DRAFT_45021 [Mixia osmundae IAM 14324]GAA95295.1 hypothetical protein E5Q_01951 [Mixia osmundae IAM 14324]
MRAKKRSKRTDDKVKVTPTSQLIARYHALEKRLARETDAIVRAQLKAEQEELGGLATYQDSSLQGSDKTKGGQTAKWSVKQLIELQGKISMRVLDVGAIEGTAYAKQSTWLDVTYLDLNPRADHVIKGDFLTFPPETDKQEDKFDMICLSLVINFVGDIKARADMVRRAHRLLRDNGLLFIVLPLPCLENSRYLNSPRFEAILATLGFARIRQHDSAKLTHWLFRRTQAGNTTAWPRREVRAGAKRNNFVLIV